MLWNKCCSASSDIRKWNLGHHSISMRYKKLRSLCNLQNVYRLDKEQEEGEDTGLGKVGLEMCREIPVGYWDAAAIPVQWEVQETSSWLRSSGWGGAVAVKGLRQPARAGQQKYTTSIFTGCLPWRSPWQQQGLHNLQSTQHRGRGGQTGRPEVLRLRRCCFSIKVDS